MYICIALLLYISEQAVRSLNKWQADGKVETEMFRPPGMGQTDFLLQRRV